MLQSTTTMRIAEIILNSITTLAAAIGAAVALSGLNAWKKQLKGKNDYELARRYLKAVYGLRDALKFVRFAFISSEEISSAMMKNGDSDKTIPDSHDTSRAVYSLRWKKVTEAVSELDIELREAETIWGKSALEIKKDLDVCKIELYINLRKFLDFEAKLPFDRDVIYDHGDNDNYNQKLDAAINKIENHLKPHLK